MEHRTGSEAATGEFGFIRKIFWILLDFLEQSIFQVPFLVSNVHSLPLVLEDMGSGRNVFFQKWLKVVFTWGPATYSLLLAHTHTQVNEGNMDQTSIGAKL